MLIYLLFRFCLLYIAKKNDKYKWFKKKLFAVKTKKTKKQKGIIMSKLGSLIAVY